MCIRDSKKRTSRPGMLYDLTSLQREANSRLGYSAKRTLGICLLYTSDAADERSSVDLGGRRIIKKKNKYNIQTSASQLRTRS